MATRQDAGNPGGDDAPRLTRWQRLKYTIVQPDDDKTEAVADDRTVEELEAAIRSSDDKERAIGLIAAPLAAIVGIIVSSATIQNARNHHDSTTVFVELTYVILGMAVLILVSSLLRKRLFQGITLALYGLAVFNLRFWGFGVPFLLAGAWYLVRAYRLQQALKRAEGDSPSRAPRSKGSTTRTNGARPRPNKRYTPPT
jgi:Ca2+/Na+ antiporter